MNVIRRVLLVEKIFSRGSKAGAPKERKKKKTNKNDGRVGHEVKVQLVCVCWLSRPEKEMVYDSIQKGNWLLDG